MLKLFKRLVIANEQAVELLREHKSFLKIYNQNLEDYISMYHEEVQKNKELEQRIKLLEAK